MRVLYIVYWGALEQLGQSLVVPGVLRIAKNDVDLTLVTFEKPLDLEDADRVAEVRDIFENAGVSWVPLKYHQTPKIPATAFDVTQGVAKSLAKRFNGKFDIVHARTFQAGLIGMILSRLLRASFIYHNEGYYPDEQVDAGVWGIDSKPHRYAKMLERALYRKSDAVICLSERSAKELRALNSFVEVVPSCVDLQKFEIQPVSDSRSFRFVYLGSVGGRYDLRRIAKFVAEIESSGVSVELRIYSKADRALINSEIEGTGLEPGAYSVEALSFEDVPEKIGQCDAGIHFLKPGIAEHAGSPTKIGEYWAVGLPVVMTPGMGDTDLVTENHRVGTVFSSETSATETFEKVRSIVDDVDHRERCRSVAKKVYGIDDAVETQLRIYRKLVE